MSLFMSVHRFCLFSSIRRWSRMAAIASTAAMLIVIQPCHTVYGSTGDGESFFSATKSIDLLGEVYRQVSQNYVDSIDVSEFMYSGIDGMLRQLDPYTAFLDEAQSDELEEITSGQYAGIGITIGVISGDLFITSVIEGQPAAKAGLQIGDQIVSVNGVKASRKSLDEVRGSIKGAAGTTVRLTIRKDGRGALKNYTLTRGEVRVSTVPYAGIFGASGYVQMNSFGEHSKDELSSAIRIIREQAGNDKIGLNGIVLDLRGNPGGLLTSAVDVASLFVEKGSRIVSTRGRTAESEQVYVTRTEPQVPSLPLVVMIDADSASASEIVAGAMQELDRGVILGGGSFGKGLVQSIINLPYDYILKLTTAKYYTPSGRLIQKPLSPEAQDRRVVLSDVAGDSTKVFYTRNRRKVFGGGGIRPDISVKADSLSEYQHVLEKEGLLFRYASRFHLKNPAFQVKQLSLEPLYDDFNHFLRKERFTFRSVAQKRLDSLKVLIKKDDGADGPELAGALDSLDKVLAERTTRRISRDSVRVTAALQREILRHYDQRASLRRSIEEDPVAAKAFALLVDQKSYRAMLRP
jgi:carboxyl-terminal processing protease